MQDFKILIYIITIHFRTTILNLNLNRNKSVFISGNLFIMPDVLMQPLHNNGFYSASILFGTTKIAKKHFSLQLLLFY